MCLSLPKGEPKYIIKFIDNSNPFRFLKALKYVHVYYFSATTNLFSMDNGMVKFNGINYADWYEQIKFQLGVMV